MWIYKIDFVLLQSESCPRLWAGLMTEHLDGSYPTSKFSGINKPWVMDRRMLASMICRHLATIIGRERLFIIRLGPRKTLKW